MNYKGAVNKLNREMITCNLKIPTDKTKARVSHITSLFALLRAAHNSIMGN
jgi:hypothetical protein